MTRRASARLQQYSERRFDAGLRLRSQFDRGLGALVLGSVASLTGCQDGFDIGIGNGCDGGVALIEQSTYAIAKGPKYELIAPSEVKYVVTVEEEFEAVSFLVRPVGSSERGEVVTVARAEMRKGGDGEPDYVAELAGERCPPPSD